MSTKWKIILITAAIALLTGLSFFSGFRACKKSFSPQIDTVVVMKTINVSEPVETNSEVVDSLKLRIKFYNNLVGQKNALIGKLSDSLSTVQSSHDTVYISLPIERKEYRDSNYVAVVSGYQPKLESLTFNYPEKTVVVNTVEYKRYKWNIGVSSNLIATPKYVIPSASFYATRTFNRFDLSLHLGGNYYNGFNPHLMFEVRYNFLSW